MDNELLKNWWKRFFVTILASASTVLVFAIVRTQVVEGFEWIGALMGATLATISGLCWWYAIKGPAVSQGMCFRYALKGGKVIGGVSFLAGFVGPIIFSDSNIGPIIGFVITGPIGFVLGVIGGLIYCWYRSSSIFANSKKNPPDSL
jgi:hypothetical protein